MLVSKIKSIDNGRVLTGDSYVKNQDYSHMSTEALEQMLDTLPARGEAMRPVIEAIKAELAKRDKKNTKDAQTYQYKGYEITTRGDTYLLYKNGMYVVSAESLKEAKDIVDSYVKDDFSPEARKAAIEARRAKAKGMMKSKGSKGSSRIHPPKTDGIQVPKEEKPVDYGAVAELLKEKYGEEKGAKVYEDLIDNPGSSKGLHFVIGNKIVAEKIAMMKELGETGKPHNYLYSDLYKDYRNKIERSKAVNDGTFKELQGKLEKQGHSVESAKKIAAYIGRKKYGVEGFAKKSAAGRKK